MASRPKYVMESKYESFCKKCKKPIHIKDNITPEFISGKQAWVHLKCPTGKTFKEVISGNGQTAHQMMEEGRDILEEIEKKVFIPSVYQQAAFDWALQGIGHAVMKAVAGSGKTTTIVKMLDILPRSLRILFVAFNKSITKALVAKIRAAGYTNITIKTLNGAGFTVVRKYEGFRDLQESKVMDILTEFWPISKNDVEDPKVRSENRVKRSAMNKVVAMVKATLTDYNDPNAVLDIITRYHIEIDEQMEQEIIKRLPYVMEKNNENLEIVDYNDQCYLPLINSRLKNHFDKYDFILCDEFQDFNKCNIEFILRCLAPDGRIIAVGDHRQSLYGFRGADTQAIPSAIERLHATVLPLSVSYRCPKSHVRRIQNWVPEIQAAPDAIEGTIGDLKYEEMMEKVREGDMVLCRTNAPLIKPAFAVIKSGKKAIIRGKDIGKDLVNFIERFQCDDLGRLDILMQQYTEAEIDRWLSKNKEMMAETAKERYDTIVQVMKECVTVAELITKLETLFSDDNIGVVFSSVHRAKGLEAKCVYIYRHDLMPHAKAKTVDELEQEFNCIYVAGTRSLDELYLVSAEGDK